MVSPCDFDTFIEIIEGYFDSVFEIFNTPIEIRIEIFKPVFYTDDVDEEENK